jgi:hypothetical protein
MKNAKADACAYPASCLLQRLELQSPGLLKEMINGIKNDRLALPKEAAEKEHLEQIFIESLKILERADGLLEFSKNT